MRRSLRPLWLAVVFAGVVPLVQAAEPYGNSLDWVPADAGFYSASLRMREQVEIVAASRAWQQFKSIPSVAMAWQIAEMQVFNPEGPASMFWQLMELPENQDLANMLGEMFSDEMVVYGGSDVSRIVELLGILQGSRFAPLIEAMGEGVPAGASQARSRIRAVLQSVQEEPELLDMPELVFAFRVRDAKVAANQLKRLEVFAKLGLQQTPLKDAFKREKFAGTEFLSLTLDGSLIPWEEVNLAPFEDEAGEFDGLKEALAEKQAVVALGVWKNYVILSLGKSAEHLEKIGGPSTLGSLSEFKPLEKYRQLPITSLGYVSRELMVGMQATGSEIDDTIETLADLLEFSEDLSDDSRARITEDLEALGEDLKSSIVVPGAAINFSFLTPLGFESYAYDWTEQRGLDGTKPLEITNHFGGSPILGLASRAKHDPATYATLTKWLAKGYGYFKEFGVSRMPEKDREKAVKAMELVEPMLIRADAITRDKLIPALKDGQAAFVLDADIVSQRWHRDMPESTKPLPMLEVALVMGVSDSQLFAQAMTEYHQLAQNLVEAIRQQEPQSIPADYKVPLPLEAKTDGGNVYTFKLPTEAGLDEQVAPSGGLGPHVAVFSSSPKLAARVLKESALEASGSIAPSEPCCMVVRFDWAQLVSAATPWIEFAIRTRGGEAADGEASSQTADILNQIRMGLELLRCMKSSTSTTKLEKGVTVTHSITIVEDVK